MAFTQTQKITDTFAILADPTRLTILRILFENQEYCVSDITDKVGVSLSAVSHQLARLEAQGVVSCYRRGQKVCYHLQKNSLTSKIKNILEVTK